jgi:hypothetical protein
VSIRINAKTITPATAKIRFIEAPFWYQLGRSPLWHSVGHWLRFLIRALVQKSHNAQRFAQTAIELYCGVGQGTLNLLMGSAAL